MALLTEEARNVRKMHFIRDLTSFETEAKGTGNDYETCGTITVKPFTVHTNNI